MDFAPAVASGRIGAPEKTAAPDTDAAGKPAAAAGRTPAAAGSSAEAAGSWTADADERPPAEAGSSSAADGTLECTVVAPGDDHSKAVLSIHSRISAALSSASRYSKNICIDFGVQSRCLSSFSPSFSSFFSLGSCIRKANKPIQLSTSFIFSSTASSSRNNCIDSDVQSQSSILHPSRASCSSNRITCVLVLLLDLSIASSSFALMACTCSKPLIRVAATVA